MRHNEMNSTEFYAHKAQTDRVQREIADRKAREEKKVTTNQLQAGLAALRAIADAVRELKQVPSGHIYAAVMGTMDINAYEKAIGLLCNSGVIRKNGDLLVWNV